MTSPLNSTTWSSYSPASSSECLACFYVKIKTYLKHYGTNCLYFTVCTTALKINCFQARRNVGRRTSSRRNSTANLSSPVMRPTDLSWCHEKCQNLSKNTTSAPPNFVITALIKHPPSFAPPTLRTGTHRVRWRVAKTETRADDANISRWQRTGGGTQRKSLLQ